MFSPQFNILGPMKFVVIIPAYNEMPYIEDFLKRLKDYPYEFVFIDDGSTDGTGETIQKYGFKVIRHERNKGKGAAVKTGFAYALEKGYDAVITMDSDGQHDPALIPQFIDALRDADIVLGSRRQFMTPANMPIDRYLVNRITSTIISLLAGHLIEDPQNGYRAFRRRVLESLRFQKDRFDFETEVLIKALRYGFKLKHVNVPVIYGAEKSHINKWKDTLRAIKLYLEFLFTS